MSKNAVNPSRRLVLLDAHAILHRAYHALPDFSTASGQPTGALYGLSTMLIKIITDLKPDYIVACYDLKGPTYRHELYKEYKAGRQKADDDLVAQMKTSRDVFAAMDIPIYDKEGFEADDMLGTIVEQITNRKQGVRSKKKGKKADSPSSLPPTPYSSNIEIIIASGDMDTLQLVKGDQVKVYTLRKGISDTVMYDEKAVKTRFGFGPELIPDYKGLRGDPSDNIPGVKGVGEKTATMLTTTFGAIENLYKELDAGHEKRFTDAGITPRIIQVLKDNKEEAEFSKMLATIRLDAPITFTLPDKTFKESVDIKKAKAYWSSLEFRTLGQRLEQAVHTEGKKEIRKEGKSSEGEMTKERKGKGLTGESGIKETDVSERNKTGGLFANSVPTDGLEKAALALWIVNSNITNPTMEDVMNFSGADTFEAAKEAIFTEMKKRGLEKIYEDIELPLIPIVHRMEERGVKIDRTLLKDLSEKYHHELSALEKKIWKFAGKEFNVGSPKQLGEVLFDTLGLKVKNQKKTGAGARSTKESELEKMRDMHPIIPLLFEYREFAKLLSTYIDAIPPELDKNNRLHTHFIQSGSTTGRMASQNPNLQNIPVKTALGKAIRGAFIAEKGFKLATFDYSQMELRIAAFMSGDEKLIEIFKKGEDVHTQVASFVFKVSAGKVTPEMRRRAKVINFGIIYGMGVLALKQNLGTTREEAQNFYNEYFSTFSTLAKYLDTIKAETARKGYTETFFGRRRYFEGIKSKIPYIRAQAERMAINAPIQGTEADVIKKAMIKVDEYIKREKLEKDVFPLLQVHDELVYEIKEDAVKKVAPEIEKIMGSVLDPKNTRGVVLTAHASVGDNWGELK